MFCVHKHCWPYSTDLTLMTQNLSIFIASPYCGRVAGFKILHFISDAFDRDNRHHEMTFLENWNRETFTQWNNPSSRIWSHCQLQCSHCEFRWYKSKDKNYANYFQCLLDWTNLYHDIIMFKRGSSSKNTFWVASIVAAPSNRRRRSNGKPEIRSYYAFHTVFRFLNKWCLIKGSSVLHPSIYSWILYVW